MDYLVQVGAGEAPGVPASQGDSEASFMMASQISLPLSDPSSELDGKVHPSSSQSSNEPSNETTSTGAETNPLTAKPNIHVVAEEDHLVNSVIKSKFQASNTEPKTKIDKTDISVTPIVIDDLDQNLERPGPSGAASQTGSQRSKTDVLKSGLHNSESQNQSNNAPGQRTQIPSVSNQSSNAAGQRTQNQSSNAAGQKTQNQSSNAAGQRTQNQSSNAAGQRTQNQSSNAAGQRTQNQSGNAAGQRTQNQSSNAAGQRTQNQSGNAAGQRTQNQSSNAAGQRTQNQSSNAAGQRTQNQSSNAAGQRIQNQSSNALVERTQVPSVSNLAVAGNMNSDDSEKTPTPSSNLKKALDESKVKRTRGSTIVSVKKDTKNSNNSPNVNLNDLENDMNVKNLMKSFSDTTGETPQIRTSGRLKHRKSEPVWKDLVPKKRVSTEKIENNVLKKRPSVEKEDNRIPKQEENNETNEETDKVLKEATIKVADNEIVDCVIVKVEKVVKTQTSTEKEGRQKHGSLTVEEWLKKGTEKVLKETMVKTISNNITDCAIKMNNVSAAANKDFISGNTSSTVKSETSKFVKSEPQADSVSDTKNITKAHRATSKNCMSEPKAESVSETKNITKAHTATSKVEEQNTSIVADDVKLVEKDVKGVTCGPEKDVKGVTCGPEKDVKGVTCAPEKDVKGVTCGPEKDVKGVTCGPEKDVKGVTCCPQVNWSEKTKLDNAQPSSSGTVL